MWKPLSFALPITVICLICISPAPVPCPAASPPCSPSLHPLLCRHRLQLLPPLLQLPSFPSPAPRLLSTTCFIHPPLPLLFPHCHRIPLPQAATCQSLAPPVVSPSQRRQLFWPHRIVISRTSENGGLRTCAPPPPVPARSAAAKSSSCPPRPVDRASLANVMTDENDVPAQPAAAPARPKLGGFKRPAFVPPSFVGGAKPANLPGGAVKKPALGGGALKKPALGGGARPVAAAASRTIVTAAPAAAAQAKSGDSRYFNVLYCKCECGAEGAAPSAAQLAGCRGVRTRPRLPASPSCHAPTTCRRATEEAAAQQEVF